MREEIAEEKIIYLFEFSRLSHETLYILYRTCRLALCSTELVGREKEIKQIQMMKQIVKELLDNY